MKFNYKARTQDGELQVGNVEASDRESALNILTGHDLYVLNLEEVGPEPWWERTFSFLNRIKSEEMMIFTRQLATLLGSQVSLSDSLRNLYEQTESDRLKEVIAELSNDIDAGFSLSQALERQKPVFSEFYINMVKSAEVTGRLGEVLEFLAEHLESKGELTSKVKNALTYPIFVIILFIVVMVLMITVVFPKIAPIFTEADIQLPIYTRIVLGVGNFMASWWWLLLIGFGVLALVVFDYFQTEEGKMIFDELSLRLPIFGELFRHLYVARFSESARILIKGGLTIPQAIEISSHTIGNQVYREILHESADKVRKGELLSDALVEHDEFPPMVTQLISVGESTGQLGEMLAKVSEFYTREVDGLVNNLVALIQPILMVVIGLMVALLFASMLMPLYNMSSAL